MSLHECPGELFITMDSPLAIFFFFFFFVFFWKETVLLTFMQTVSKGGRMGAWG